RASGGVGLRRLRPDPPGRRRAEGGGPDRAAAPGGPAHRYTGAHDRGVAAGDPRIRLLLVTVGRSGPEPDRCRRGRRRAMAGGDGGYSAGDTFPKVLER